MGHPVLAAQLYTVRQFVQTAPDLAASLKKVRSIGYTAVQVSGIGPIPDADVKAMVTDVGLTICITHTSPAELWNDLDRVIARHKLWGCRHVAIGSMPQTYREQGEAGFRQFAVEASAIGERLVAAGLDFSYHNHSFEFVRIGRRTGLDVIFDESDPRYLKAEPDTYWIQHGGGDPAAWIRRCAGRAPLIHLKDMLITPQREQRYAEVGSGNLNWPAIFAAAQEAGVEWSIVEQDECYERDPFDSIAISYAYLHGLGLR